MPGETRSRFSKMKAILFACMIAQTMAVTTALYEAKKAERNKIVAACCGIAPITNDSTFNNWMNKYLITLVK